MKNTGPPNILYIDDEIVQQTPQVNYHNKSQHFQVRDARNENIIQGLLCVVNTKFIFMLYKKVREKE